MIRLLTLAFACLALPAAAQTLEVGNIAANDHLNVRSGPGTLFDVVMGLPPAFGNLTKVHCVLVKPSPASENRADYPEWCAISSGGPVMGWVNARYLVPDRSPEKTDLPLMSGFRATDDPCRIVGESAQTVDFLDHTAWLVGCPIGSPAIGQVLGEFGGEQVAVIDGYALLSIPQ